MDDFLIFDGISKNFGKTQVLKNLTFSVKKGEVFSLLGPSGCGKTTLLRLCAGFDSPEAGRILLNGEDITSLPPDKRQVNTIFQSYALFPHMTIKENIEFGLKIQKKSKAEISREVERMLDLIQMVPHADKRPSQISGGQKQRVAIARALVNKPQVLLLDEPLAALDLKLRQRMVIELDLIHDEVGITFLYVTHDQTEAMSLSDRMAVMSEGKIEQIGKPAEIYETPVSSFTAAFIGDTNFLDGRISDLLDSEYCRLAIDGLPDAVCFNDKHRKAGELVHLSLRPEKIYLHSEKPLNPENYNLLEGIVENMVYLGASTKYWIKVGEWVLTVIQQHRHFQLDRKPPVWDSFVWLSWHPDDGYMLERYAVRDEQLLTLPEDSTSMDVSNLIALDNQQEKKSKVNR